MSKINNYTKHAKKLLFHILRTIAMKKGKLLEFKNIAGSKKPQKHCFSRLTELSMIKIL